MTDKRRKDGWNFSFDPQACKACKGNCCIGESGFIWVNKKKIAEIANHLKLTTKAVLEKYVVQEKQGLSLTEVQLGPENFRCVFFDLSQRKCSIYSVRPSQCRTFPFWPRF